MSFREHALQGIAEFIIAKHRSGAVADVDMRFINHFAKFDNVTPSFRVGETVFQSRMGTDEDTDHTDISPLSFGNPSYDTMPDIMPDQNDNIPAF